MKTVFAVLHVVVFGLAAMSANAADDRRWKAPVPVEASDAGDATSPQLAFDAQGNALAVWSQPDDEDRNRTWSSRYTGIGGWGVAAPIDSTAGGTSEAQVATDASGNGLAIWLQFDSDSGRNRIGWSRYTVIDHRWVAGSTPIDTNTGNTFAPQVAIDASGNALAVWSQSVGTRTRIWWSRYTASNNNWVTATAPLDTNTGNAVAPQLAFDTNGNAVAVWQQSDGTRTNIWARRNVGGTWIAAEPLETGVGNAFTPQVAIDRNGNAFAVWHQFDSGRNRIFANRFTANAWLGATAIETNAGEASSPKIAFDASGKALVVWHQSAGGPNDIWGNHFTPSGAAGVWSGATQLETDSGDATAPVVAFDADGNAAATWQQFDGERVSIQSNVYTANEGWGEAEPIESDNAGDALTPRVAFDNNGTAVAVWFQSDGTHSNITSNRYTREKQFGRPVLFTAEGAVQTVVLNVAVKVAVASNGNALALWTEREGFLRHVYWNQYTAGRGWGTAALFAANSDLTTSDLKVAFAPDNTALAVWQQDSHIWSRHYTATDGWAAPVRADPQSDHSWFPSFVFDANGNALALWQQRVMVNGLETSVMHSSRHTVGQDWSPAEQIPGGDPALAPLIEVDGTGNALAVWVQSPGSGLPNQLWWNRYTPVGGWGAPSQIDIGTEIHLTHPAQFAVDVRGNAVVVWEADDGTRFSSWAHYYTPDEGWSPAFQLGSAASDALPSTLAFAPDGTALVVWNQLFSGSWRNWFVRYTPGNGWGTAAEIRPELSARFSESHAHIAFDATGKALMVWNQRVGVEGVRSTWAMHYTAADGWTGAGPIETNTVHSVDPKHIAFDENGNALVIGRQITGPIGAPYELWSNRFE